MPAQSRSIDSPNGRIVLLDRVGAGAFGEVFRARSESDGSQVAVKIVSAADGFALQTLVNEAELAQQIDHPNVVKVLFGGLDPDFGFYMVSEFVEGESLLSMLDNRRMADEQLSLDEAISLMMGIAEGAAAVNDVLVHRDIKPDNILLADNSVKIVDFGLSKVVSERTRTQTFKGVGPIAYMAPEAWENMPNTPKMDIYSVGIVFYEILTLKHPLKHLVEIDSMEAWRKAHFYGVPEPIHSHHEHVGRPLSTLVSRMIAKRPEDRPDWPQILSTLSSPNAAGSDARMDTILQKADERRQTVERETAEQFREQEVRRGKDKLLRGRFRDLISEFNDKVDVFNSRFLGDKITSQTKPNTVSYFVPHGRSIKFHLFERREESIQIQGHTLIGGAVVSIQNATSANLILVSTSEEDVYGEWLCCIVRVSALTDPRAAVGLLRSPPEREPFGFSSAQDFYEHIRHAGTGVMHVFRYELTREIDEVLTDLLEVSFST